MSSESLIEKILLIEELRGGIKRKMKVEEVCTYDGYGRVVWRTKARMMQTREKWA
jgi:hypothetical protein